MAFQWFNPKKTTRWIEINQKGSESTKRLSAICPSCSDEIKRDRGSWMGKCKTCNALYSFFEGTPAQIIAASIESPIFYNIGAVGSGKTTISSYITSNHMRKVPGAVVLAFAMTLQQLKRFAAPELESFFHKDEWKTKTQSLWVLNNGSSIEFIASDDEQKVRSANATVIWLVEAATAKMKPIFKQGLSRLRNTAGIVYAYNLDGSIKRNYYESGLSSPVILENYNIMIIEANVKKNSWLKKEILKSHTIFYTTSVRGIDILKKQAKPQRSVSKFTGKEENNPSITLLSASWDNPILTETWFKTTRASMDSEEEYHREIYCDMTSEDGLVFKDFIINLDKIFIPMHSTYTADPNVVWVETMDPGGSKEENDETAYLLAQFNKVEKTLKFVDYFRLSGKTLAEECVLISQIRAKHGWTRNRSYLFTGDSVLERALKTSKYQSLKTDYELRLGVSIDVCTAKGIKQGINKVIEWFQAEAITFSDQLEGMRYEILNYEYLTKLEIVKGIPTDVQRFSAGEEHLIDALRYLIVKLEEYGHRMDQHRIDSVRDKNNEINNYKKEQRNKQITYSNLIEKAFLDNLPPMLLEGQPHTNIISRSKKIL